MAPLNSIVGGVLKVFFNPTTKIMSEVGCEPENDCNTDGLTFKSFTLRWLAIATQLVPSLGDTVWPYIQASATGAAGQCDGNGGSWCGYHWNTQTWDGSMGVGQQMSALAAISANLITVEGLAAPLTLDTGATSKGNAAAGTGSTTTATGSPWLTKKITTGDRAGAGILTALLLAYTIGGAYWLCSY
jgi:mannan endo-1,6-alpha-mannosidase